MKYTTLLLAPLIAAASELSLTYLTEAMDYNEYMHGEKLDSEKSDLGGSLSGYRLQASSAFALQGPQEYLSVGITLDRLLGQTAYTGSYISDGCTTYGCLRSKSTAEISDSSLRLGVGVEHSSTQKEIALILGKRKWKRSLSPTQHETYTWNYYGVELGGRIREGFQAGGAYIGYKKASQAIMRSEEEGWDFHLGNTYTTYVRIPLRQHFTRRLYLDATYTYERQHIGESGHIYIDETTYYFEPRSTSIQQVVSLGMGFLF